MANVTITSLIGPDDVWGHQPHVPSADRVAGAIIWAMSAHLLLSGPANALISVQPWRSDPPTTSHVALLPPIGVSLPLKVEAWLAAWSAATSLGQILVITKMGNFLIWRVNLIVRSPLSKRIYNSLAFASLSSFFLPLHTTNIKTNSRFILSNPTTKHKLLQNTQSVAQRNNFKMGAVVSCVSFPSTRPTRKFSG